MIKREIKRIFRICHIKLHAGILANKTIATHMVFNFFDGIFMDLPIIHTIGKVRTTTTMIGPRWKGSLAAEITLSEVLFDRFWFKLCSFHPFPTLLLSIVRNECYIKLKPLIEKFPILGQLRNKSILPQLILNKSSDWGEDKLRFLWGIYNLGICVILLPGRKTDKLFQNDHLISCQFSLYLSETGDRWRLWSVTNEIELAKPLKTTDGMT